MARRRLIRDLTAAGVYEATACDAGLVLSELISNALRHATPLPGSQVRVSWRLRKHSVKVAVSDGGGPTQPVVSEPASSAVGGRGLGIVQRLSLRWGVCDGSADGAGHEATGETTVWAELALHPDGGGESAGAAADANASAAQGSTLLGPDLVIASSRDA